MREIIKMTNITNKNHLQQATLAGGCFWCIESAFSQVKGVHSAISGYMGGHVANPTYEDICTGNSGHAEVVQLSFDADEVNYQEIIEIFFTLHNPTQLNRQGNDIGSQYRSAIFYHDDAQQSIAQKIIREMAATKTFEQAIVTQVCPTEFFYSGEAYHQNYFNNNSQNQYCQMIVAPKLTKFKQTFADKLK